MLATVVKPDDAMMTAAITTDADSQLIQDQDAAKHGLYYSLVILCRIWGTGIRGLMRGIKQPSTKVTS